MEKLCRLCKKRPALLPDRNKFSRRKEVCRECHAERLRNDLKVIMEARKKKAFLQ